MGGGTIISGRSTDKLNDRTVRGFVSTNARSRIAARSKLADGGGLYLSVTRAGTPIWRIKYRFGGKERLYAVGTYPEISLADARAERQRVKALLREGRDPVRARQLDRAVRTVAEENTFDQLATSWLERRRLKKGWSAIHYEKSRQALERDVIPYLGRFPIDAITPTMVAAVIETIIRRGAHETAAKVLQNIVRIFGRAKALGLRKDNPAADLAAELIPQRNTPKNRPALLTFPELGNLLRRTEMASISPAVRMALKLIAYTAQRIGNVVTATWDEFDLDSDIPTWTIPRGQMKVRRRRNDHRVLLGPTIACELRIWRQVTGGKGHVFPSPTGSAHLTLEALEKVYRVTLGMRDRHTVHGWRSAFSTLAKDSGLFENEAVDLTLDHVHDSQVALAYDRGERLEARRKLVLWWDTQLTAAQHGEDVVPIGRAGVA